MSAGLARGLWLLAVAMGAGVGAELVWPAPIPPVVRAPPPPRSPAAMGPEPVERWADTVLARPLFSPSRRPRSEAAAVRSAAPAAGEPPRLSGIVTSERGRMALFDPVSPDGHTTLAAEGARLGAWQVERIGAETVELSGPDGRRSVRPSFSGGAARVTREAPGGTFEAAAQPSGAAIFSHAPTASAARPAR